MLNRREAIIGSAAAGIAILTRGARDVFADGPQPKTPLNFRPPAGATDTHRHVYGDPKKFPYAASTRYHHPPATIEDMRKLDAALHLDRCVLVQPSAYDTDNSALLDTLKQYGTKVCRGVCDLADDTTDKTLEDWNRLGVRGIRVGAGPTAQEATKNLTAVAARIKGLGWHMNTALSPALIESMQDTLAKMAVPVVIDHYGGARVADGPQQKGFVALLGLLKTGNIYVKMSRLHNLSTAAPGYADVAPFTKALVAANHERLLFGTDWPHAGIVPPGKTAADVSPYFDFDDGLVFNNLASAVGDQARLKTILVDNPARLYGFR